MKLKKALPSNRTYDQVLNHYLVEKEIAQRIKEAKPEDRKKIYATMYDQLFEKVPDHPRLTVRDNIQLTQKSNNSKYSHIKNLIGPQTVFAEFAPGDSKFAAFMTKHVKHVYGIDISDQRDSNDPVIENYTLIVYDGYNLNQISNNSIDVIYSDQLIEHFHPDETRPHFEICQNKLKIGGSYIFRTPHAQSGPYDVSMYFSDNPDCFHLKEWTFTDLFVLLKEIGFTKVSGFWSAKGINIKLPNEYFIIVEKLIKYFPVKIRKKLSKLSMPCILCQVKK